MVSEENATAPQAAGVIHTDFESHFIRAEVIRASDYIEHHGEAGVKKAGKWRLEGKDYQVQGWRYSSYSCKCIAHHYRLTNINENFSPI